MIHSQRFALQLHEFDRARKLYEKYLEVRCCVSSVLAGDLTDLLDSLIPQTVPPGSNLRSSKSCLEILSELGQSLSWQFRSPLWTCQNSFGRRILTLSSRKESESGLALCMNACWRSPSTSKSGLPMRGSRWRRWEAATTRRKKKGTVRRVQPIPRGPERYTRGHIVISRQNAIDQTCRTISKGCEKSRLRYARSSRSWCRPTLYLFVVTARRTCAQLMETLRRGERLCRRH